MSYLDENLPASEGCGSPVGERDRENHPNSRTILLFRLILQSNSKCLSRSHKHHSGPQLWPQITTELELLHDSYLVPVSLSN